MSEVKIPTVGRIVHYFPVNDDNCQYNNAEILPAISLKIWGGLCIDISVFTLNFDVPNVIRFTVCHKSQVSRDTNGKPLSNYWDYPEIK